MSSIYTKQKHDREKRLLKRQGDRHEILQSLQVVKRHKRSDVAKKISVRRAPSMGAKAPSIGAKAPAMGAKAPAMGGHSFGQELKSFLVTELDWPSVLAGIVVGYGAFERLFVFTPSKNSGALRALTQLPDLTYKWSILARLKNVQPELCHLAVLNNCLWISPSKSCGNKTRRLDLSLPSDGYGKWIGEPGLRKISHAGNLIGTHGNDWWVVGGYDKEFDQITLVLNVFAPSCNESWVKLPPLPKSKNSGTLASWKTSLYVFHARTQFGHDVGEDIEFLVMHNVVSLTNAKVETKGETNVEAKSTEAKRWQMVQAAP